MNITRLVAAALLCCASTAQAAPLDVQPIAYHAKHSEVPLEQNLKMPFVEAAQPGVAARINNLLYIDQLGMLAPAKRSDGLGKPSSEANGISELDYKVVRNDGRLFSLALTGEFCGAYCEGNESYYNFDAAQGRHLLLTDLLTTQGREALGKRLTTERLATLQQQIDKLKKAKPDEDTQAAIEMYQGCTEGFGESAVGNNSFSIGDKAVTFVRERCSNHALHALDELDTFRNPITFSDLKPYLSDYGNTLLLGNAAATPAASSPFEQILHGQIDGKLPITMLLHRQDDNSVNGTYFYDKHRTAIALSGQQNGDTLELTETESTDTPAPTIKASVKGEKLQGQWQGKKQLGFEAAP